MNIHKIVNRISSLPLKSLARIDSLLQSNISMRNLNQTKIRVAISQMEVTKPLSLKNQSNKRDWMIRHQLMSKRKKSLQMRLRIICCNQSDSGCQ
jgi:hypothetical protein